MWRRPPRRNSAARTRLIVGLGNPGRRYIGTFHNAGFEAAGLLARGCGIRLRPAGPVDLGAGNAEGHPVLIVRPLLFMNRSGAAVAPLYRECGAVPGDLIVVHDDMDIPLGRIRLKRGGGTGGHKGLGSLEQELGTRDFLRVRIGIGRPPEGADPADYVLSRVPAEARLLFDAGVGAAGEAVREILAAGFEKAATRWNARRGEASPPGAEEEEGLLAPGTDAGGSNIRKEEGRTDDETV